MRTLGYHIVISGYGLWLPGDDRGCWSEKWDKQIGFCEPHTLHPADACRAQMADERMKHDPVRLRPEMIDVIVETLAECQAASDWKFVAVSIEATHTHLLVTYTERDIDLTVKWIKDQCTKAIHLRAEHYGPVWCKGRWRSYIFAEDVWQATKNYIERHNERRGVGPRPYAFLA